MPLSAPASATHQRSSDSTSHQVLLTVSGEVSSDLEQQIAEGARPRADYLDMAERFGADLLDYGEARRTSGWFGRVLETLGGANLLLAWACYQRRHRYKVLFTDGEQVGIPYALMAKLFGGQLPQHMMVAHILSVGKKTWLFDRFGLAEDIHFLVYSTWQQRFVEDRWSVPPERVTFTPFMVDSRFFSAEQVTPGQSELSEQLDRGRPLICAVGLERRDYPTLMQAVRGLDVHLVVAAGSPWSKQKDSTEGEAIPENVTVRRFSLHELRQLYADSRFLVMPLFDVDFQAGVTAMLEAMSMGKSMVCSRTPGQTDVVVEGETGLYVKPGDVGELRGAIQHLLDNPDIADSMGQNARRLIDEEMSLDRYVHRLGDLVEAHQE